MSNTPTASGWKKPLAIVLCIAIGVLANMSTDLQKVWFRRIFCDLIGRWVEDGEYPADYEALGEIVRAVCYENAKNYFGF